MSNKVPTFLQLIHPLLDPVLRWDESLKVFPLLHDDHCKLAEVRETQEIRLLPLKPRVLSAQSHVSRCRELLHAWGKLTLPVHAFFFF
jgi:hypothetical protein